MAEVAAGLLVAEQVVSTGVEAAVAVAVAKPTQPLRATLNQVAAAAAGDSSLALARSNNSATVIDDRLFIFGGEDANGRMCTTDVHAVSLPSESRPVAEYACFPAFPLQDGAGHLLVPSPRAEHAACARHKCVIVYGGRDASGSPIPEDSCLWSWSSEDLKWSRIETTTQVGKTLAARFGHQLFFHDKQDLLILHGGRNSAEEASTDTWQYSFTTRAWTVLPSAPTASTAAAFSNGVLYAVSGASELSGEIQYLDLSLSPEDQEKPNALVWQTVSFPRSALTPGPSPRIGAALAPVSAGMGRDYLVYMLGSRLADSDAEPFFSDIWALQLPASKKTAAGLKDAVRDLVPGVDPGRFSWAEVEIVPTEQTVPEGKVHPGPRAFFGASGCLNGKGVVFWGGLNSEKKLEADGWLLQVS